MYCDRKQFRGCLGPSVGEKLTEKGHRKLFSDDGNVLYIDCDTDYPGGEVCKSSPSTPIKMSAF